MEEIERRVRFVKKADNERSKKRRATTTAPIQNMTTASVF